MNVNQTAFCTTTLLALGTGAAVFGCVSALSAKAITIAAVAYGVLAALSFSFSIAAASAWATSKEGDSVESYFAKIQEYAGYTIAGTLQVISTAFFQALIQGAIQGISKAVSRAISGADVTFENQSNKV